MKKLLLTFCVLMLTHVTYAQYAVETAKNLGENFRLWSVTQSEVYKTNIEKLCDGKKSTRVADQIAMDLAVKNNYPLNKSYELDSYLNWLDKQIEEIGIAFSDFEYIDGGNVSIFNPGNVKTAKEVEYVSCKIQINGSLSYEVKDLLYIRNGKISKIDAYKETIDKKTGKKKVSVDFSDFIDEEESFGFTYNYGKHFPIGGSFFYSFEDVPIMVSLDFGVNMDDDKYITDKVEMTDIMNYKRTKKTLDPKYFITVTPHIYFRYIAVGCGVGVLSLTGTEENATGVSTGNSSGSSNISISQSANTKSSTSAESYKFMIRPTVKGFIPFNDEYALTLNVGYDYVFGYNEKNGLSFGLGIKYTFE